jgi:hypothetical protein
VVLLIALLIPLSGCLLLAAGAGGGPGATWYYSAAREEVGSDPREVVAAAAAALEEMDITVTTRKASAIDGEVVGRTARDEKVQVTATSRVEGRTAVEVRVGLIDDDAARRILGEIVRRL